MHDRGVHGLDEVTRFRMLMIATGYEDGNDADRLRRDPIFKMVSPYPRKVTEL